MINEPSVDAMIRKLGSEKEPISSYELCVLVSKRARQVIEQIQNSGTAAENGNQKEILIACQDIMDGKVKAVKD